MSVSINLCEEEYVVVHQDVHPAVQFKPKFRFYWKSDVFLKKREDVKWWNRFFVPKALHYRTEFVKSQDDNYDFGERVIVTFVDDEIQSIRKVELENYDDEIETQVVVETPISENAVEEFKDVELVDVATEKK